MPNREVVVLTGEATVESAVEAMKLGAREFLTKPISLKELDRLVRKAYETGQLRKENRQLKAALRHQQTPPQIIGESSANAGDVPIDRQGWSHQQTDSHSRRKWDRKRTGRPGIA